MRAIVIASDPEDGWARFLGLALVLHLLSVLMLTVSFFRRGYAPLTGSLILFLVALPLYISFIAPQMDPQLGGVAARRVIPITTNELLNDPAYRVYLFDRTSTDFIFYRRRISDNVLFDYMIIPSSEIQGLRLP
ncbi:MAG: hypothetical protein M3441_04950 [Chloroflexota bacterium]|nr:hypothetical protein [Chloroflexota bacterium]